MHVLRCKKSCFYCEIELFRACDPVALLTNELLKVFTLSVL